jgi:hypothetical protein
LDPELITDPDHKLQIISDPAGSGCTTLSHSKFLHVTVLFSSYRFLFVANYVPSGFPLFPVADDDVLFESDGSRSGSEVRYTYI